MSREYHIDRLLYLSPPNEQGIAWIKRPFLNGLSGSFVQMTDNGYVPVVDTRGRPIEANLISFYPTISREATQELGGPDKVSKIKRSLGGDLQIVFERGVFRIVFLGDILFKAYLNKLRYLSINLNSPDALHDRVESDIFSFNCPLLYPLDPDYYIKLRAYLKYDSYGIYRLLQLKDIGSTWCHKLLQESIVPTVKIIGKAPRGGHVAVV
ncbi:hypothetical protein H3C65_04305 [Patescibacteria group bacterium]|nr:hypothetical protein [Patescibacteria group bacterium]